MDTKTISLSFAKTTTTRRNITDIKIIEWLLVFAITAICAITVLALVNAAGYRSGYCKALNGKETFIDGKNYCVVNNDYNHPIAYPED